MCLSACQRKVNNLRVRVTDYSAPCLFFRRPGEEFTFEELTPTGVCPDLFAQIYPQYLSLLYDGEPGSLNAGTRGALIACPGVEGKTVWRITGKTLLLSPLINLAEKLFRMVGRPRDLFDKKIILELVDSQGNCPMGYLGNVRFSFNQYSHLWSRRFFCPAVFYTVYPFLSRPAKTFVSDTPPLRIQCPADNSAIVFEVTKVSE